MGGLPANVVRLRPRGGALNAVKTGVFAKSALLPGEDREEFEEHVQGYVDHFQPQGVPERDAVMSLALEAWRERRLHQGHALKVLLLSWDDGPFCELLEAVEEVQDELDSLQRRLDRLERERKKGTARHANAVRAAASLLPRLLGLRHTKLCALPDRKLTALSGEVRHQLRDRIDGLRREKRRLNRKISRLRVDPEPQWMQLLDRERSRVLRNKEKALRVLVATRALGPDETTDLAGSRVAGARALVGIPD